MSLTLAALLVVAASPPPIVAAQPPGAVATAPTLSLAALGSTSFMSFYGQAAEQTVTLPVQSGLVPAELIATVWTPVDVRTATLTVTQEERVISRIDLPDGGPHEIRIPLTGVRIYDNAFTITMSAYLLPLEGYCLDPTNPLRLSDMSVRFDGEERRPTTVADFLPPVLRKLTVFVPDSPTRTEADIAVKVTDAIVEQYGQQYTQVSLEALPEGETVPAAPALPMERQIVIKEGPQSELVLQPSSGMPSLLITGTVNELENQTRLLSSNLSQLALSTGAAVGPLRSTPVLPGDTATLGDIGQTSVTSVSLAPRVTLGIDQTQFGRSIHAVRLQLRGSFTPLPDTLGGQLVAMIGDRPIDRWEVDQNGLIDRWVDIPDPWLMRYTTVTVALEITGNTGQCGEFQPLTLTIDDSSTVESTTANPPVPAGFQSMPEALMPNIQIGIGADTFRDTARAMALITGLQRVSAIPFNTSVVSIEEALASSTPAILIAADGWSYPEVTLPVAGSKDQVDTIEGFDDDGNPATLTLEPGFPFGSLQTVVDGDRSLLVATSTGAPERLDGLLGWLNEDIRRWVALDGVAILAPPDRAPVIVAAPRNSQRPQAQNPTRGPGRTWWYVGAGVAGLIALTGLFMFVHSRRRRPDDDG